MVFSLVIYLLIDIPPYRAVLEWTRTESNRPRCACKALPPPWNMRAHINLAIFCNIQYMRLEPVLIHLGQLQLHDHQPVLYSRMNTILHYPTVKSPTSDSTTSIPQTSPRPNASRTASSASISLKACTSTTRLTSYLNVFMPYYSTRNIHLQLDRVKGFEPSFSFHYALVVRSHRHYTRMLEIRPYAPD